MSIQNSSIVFALACLLSAGCSSNVSGSQNGCDGDSCDSDTTLPSDAESDTSGPSDTGSDTTVSSDSESDTVIPSDSGSQSETSDSDTQEPETGSPSQSEDSGSETSDTDTGTGVPEDDTDTGDDPTDPHGTTRGFLFTAKPDTHLATKHRLYFASYDGETITDLSGEVKLDVFTPCWADNGRHIYFVQGYDVRTVPWPVPATFEPTPLKVTGWSIEVSCREKTLVYTSQPSDGDSVHVYTRSMNINDEKQITTYSGTLVINKPMMPSLSPDLDAVVYGLLNGDDAYDAYSSDLYVAHLGDKITRTNITKEAKIFQAKVANRAPEWSPDGSLIAYLHVFNGKSEISTIDPTAPETSKKIITEIDNGFGGGDVLAWSPDSQRLAVIDGNEFGTIRIIDLDGVEQSRIETGLFKINSLSWR